MPSWLVLYMDLSHDQMAYAAIIATLIFGAGFIGISGVVQSGISFDDAFEENAGGTVSISVRASTPMVMVSRTSSRRPSTEPIQRMQIPIRMV